ncbi:MAG: DUF2784 domain-containing protein [Nitrospiria bacterium]
MFYRILADLVLLVHLSFVLFVVLGGTLVFRIKGWAWLHLPAVVWAAGIALFGGLCPLTPLENWLREMGGAAGYSTGFIEHYLLPILYPVILTRRLQVTLGFLVLGINLGIYVWMFRGRVVRLASRK